MDRVWFYLCAGEQVGPVTEAELMALAKEGRLSRGDLIWKETMLDWVPAGSMKGIFAGPPPAPMSIHPSPNANGSMRTLVLDSVDPAANARMLDQLRHDTADMRRFLDEMFRVLVRLNPVNSQVYEFLGYINSITDQTPRHEIANLVGQALGAVDLVNAVTMLDDSDEGIVGVAGYIVRANAENLDKVWPGYREAVQHPWIQNPVAEAYPVQESIRRALKLHRSDLIEIQKHFRQLQEFFPRYHGIMSRSGFWDIVTGFASGFFGGSLGTTGHEIWENWRNKSDSDFAQSFGGAVDLFTNTALQFTQQTEQLVAAACESLISEFVHCDEAIIVALTQLAVAKDLTPIYVALHHPNQNQNEDEYVREVTGLVLTNLKEQGLSEPSERNLRAILGV